VQNLLQLGQRLVSVFASSGFDEGSKSWGDAAWFLDSDNISLHRLGILEIFLRNMVSSSRVAPFCWMLMWISRSLAVWDVVDMSCSSGAVLEWGWGILGTIQRVVLHSMGAGLIRAVRFWMSCQGGGGPNSFVASNAGVLGD
jgi:hypothetical protein